MLRSLLRRISRSPRRRNGGPATPQAVLADAAAARGREERDLEHAQQQIRRLDRLEDENDIAAKFRHAFRGDE